MYSLVELTKKVAELKDWTLEGESIMKLYDFGDFKKSIDFISKVAEIAEKNNHHPEIFINEGNVRLSLTTNSAKSLTELDFKVAEEIDMVEKG